MFEESGLPGFGLLDFLPVGIPILVAGILYMVLWGRFRLPVRSNPDETSDTAPLASSSASTT